MQRLFIAILFILFHYVSTAQFGITIKQNFNSFQVWEDRSAAALRSTVDLFPLGQEYGFDYWVRLKNRRIDFLPQLAFSTFRTKLNGSSFIDGYILNRGHFNLNTNFYFLDFNNDCDCPTFSKQGNFLTKGFFIQLSPGIVYNRELINYIVDDPDYDLKTNVSYKLGIALGLDIGFTDLFMITPMVGFNYYPSVDWESFDLLHYDATIISPTSNQTTIQEFQVGIRLGFRPDYQNRF